MKAHPFVGFLAYCRKLQVPVFFFFFHYSFDDDICN